MSRTGEGVGEFFLKIRVRSHPDVARRHYPDLVGSRQADADAGLP